MCEQKLNVMETDFQTAGDKKISIQFSTVSFVYTSLIEYNFHWSLCDIKGNNMYIINEYREGETKNGNLKQLTW